MKVTVAERAPQADTRSVFAIRAAVIIFRRAGLSAVAEALSLVYDASV